MITKRELGHRIRDLRQQKGLSQLDFSADIGVSTTTLMLWETGARYPQLELLDRCAKGLGVTVSTLLLEGGTPKGIPTEREIGDRIASWRTLRNMSLQKLANKAGVGTSTIFNLETGEWYAKMPTYLYLAEALDISLDALIYGEARA